MFWVLMYLSHWDQGSDCFQEVSMMLWKGVGEPVVQGSRVFHWYRAKWHKDTPPPSPDFYKTGSKASPVSRTWWTICCSSIALCWVPDGEEGAPGPFSSVSSMTSSLLPLGQAPQQQPPCGAFARGQPFSVIVTGRQGMVVNTRELVCQLGHQRLGEMEVTDLHLFHWWVGDLGPYGTLLCHGPQFPSTETCLGARQLLTSVPWCSSHVTQGADGRRRVACCMPRSHPSVFSSYDWWFIWYAKPF